MTSYVSVALRQLVIDRANQRCEYCLIPQLASFLTFEVEHIIAEKHRGQTVASNLALACPFCNRNKGTDLGSIDELTGSLTPFFHPRTQNWHDHFQFIDNRILGLTGVGRVTVIIFQFNSLERVKERTVLIEAGVYPG